MIHNHGLQVSILALLSGNKALIPLIPSQEFCAIAVSSVIWNTACERHWKAGPSAAAASPPQTFHRDRGTGDPLETVP